MCLEYCLTLSSSHKHIKLALEMCCLVMINAKDDAYTVCGLTFSNKLLIQVCLLTSCAMSEFIQAVPLKESSVWRTELKRFIAWISTAQRGPWHSLALVLPKLTGTCFNSLFTIQALHWPLREKNSAYSHLLYWISYFNRIPKTAFFRCGSHFFSYSLSSLLLTSTNMGL